MKKFLNIFIVSIIMVMCGGIFFQCAAIATEKEWHKLTDEALDHYYYGRKAEAIASGRQALKAAEEIFGKDDLKTVGSIDDLATYLASTGQIEEADMLYQRAFAILEKRLSPDDSYLAIFMDYLALFYNKIGKKEYAESLKKRAKDIRLKKNSGEVKNDRSE